MCTYNGAWRESWVFKAGAVYVSISLGIICQSKAATLVIYQLGVSVLKAAAAKSFKRKGQPAGKGPVSQDTRSAQSGTGVAAWYGSVKSKGFILRAEW